MSQELFLKKRCKRLGYILGASCLLNVSLLAFGIYEWQEAGFSSLAISSFRPQKSKLFRQNGKDLPTLTQTLRELELQEYDALIALLTDETPVAEGYKKQDLAAAMLGHKYYFDVERAIGAPLAVRRLFSYMSQNDASTGIILYPGANMEAIVHFSKTERFPQTAEGLLVEYKKNQDPNIKDLFLQSNEYRSVEILLTRGTTFSRDEIFELVSAIDYKLIRNFHNEMVKSQDFSPEVRRGFLLTALPHSAIFLYKTDPRFCAHSLTDKQALAVLAALGSTQSAQECAKGYALELLEAPRTKAVWTAAMATLDPTCNSRQALLERHGRIKKTVVKDQTDSKKTPTAKAPAPTAKPKPKPAPMSKPALVHVVQQGDTLWHLSKRYGVDIETIKKYNKLTSDALKPGSTLRIPQDKGVSNSRRQ